MSLKMKLFNIVQNNLISINFIKKYLMNESMKFILKKLILLRNRLWNNLINNKD